MAGVVPVSRVLDLAAATPADADPQLWEDIAGTLQSLDNYYKPDNGKGDEARQARFREFAVATLKPAFARVGWEAKAGEAAPVAILRTELIGALAGLGDADVIAEARRRFAADEMPAPLRRTILGVVAHHADAATWEKLHEMAKNEKTPLVKDQLYSLLSIPKDPKLAQRALDLALTDEPGETNSAGMIGIVAGQHPDMAFDFAVAHKAQVDKRVDTTSASRYYPGLGSNSLDPAMIGKLRDFAGKNIAESSRRATDTAIANIEYRTKVKRERLPEVDAWLAKHAK
jgi:aminopeptidase N